MQKQRYLQISCFKSTWWDLKFNGIQGQIFQGRILLAKKSQNKQNKQKANKQTEEEVVWGINYSKWFPREGKICMICIDSESSAVYWDFLPG